MPALFANTQQESSVLGVLLSGVVHRGSVMTWGGKYRARTVLVASKLSQHVFHCWAHFHGARGKPYYCVPFLVVVVITVFGSRRSAMLLDSLFLQAHLLLVQPQHGPCGVDEGMGTAHWLFLRSKADTIIYKMVLKAT